MRIAIVAVLAACGAAPREPLAWRHVAAYHIAAASDVRWPVERTLFIGTMHNAGLLRLDDDLAGPVARPRLIAIAGGPAAGTRVAVSGIGRAVTRDEAAAGAVLALADVREERDITAPHLAGYPLMRRDADLSVALPQTRVTAEGIVRLHDGAFALELPTGERVPLVVTACDGEAEARAHLDQHRRVDGMLTDVGATLAIGMPAFDQ